MPPHTRNLIALAAGVISALLFSAVMTGSPLSLVVMPFSMLPLFLVGLSTGLGTTLTSSFLATALVAVMGGLIGAVAYVLTQALPAVAISRYIIKPQKLPNGSLTWLPPSKILGYLTAYAALILMVIFIGSSGFEGGFIGLVERQIATALEPMIAGNINSKESITIFARQIAQLAPGTMAGWWLAITIISLGIANLLLKRWGRNLRPSLELSKATTPIWIFIAWGASLLLGLVTDGITSIIAWNLFQILLVPFILVGLMVFHSICRGWGPGPIFIGIFYLLIFIRGWPMFLAAALGFAEQWFRIREKIEGNNPS